METLLTKVSWRFSEGLGKVYEGLVKEKMQKKYRKGEGKVMEKLPVKVWWRFSEGLVKVWRRFSEGLEQD